MDIKESLSKLKKPELADLARRLNITNFSALKKQALIDRILAD
jgi:hypothetical protein